jgi:alpha-ketoglutarate-dependent taurine dioxygenase
MASRLEATGAVGAELRGIDLRHIDEQSFESIRRAWIDHSVILQRFCGE